MTTEYLLEQELQMVLGCLMPVNRDVLQTMLQTGLRVSDVLALRREQIKPQFYVTERKTGKPKRVNLPDWMVEKLRGNGVGFCFPGRFPGTHQTRQAVWKDLKRACKAYRLPQNAGTHSMRKVYAVRLLERYGDIERVKRALNHSSVMVTLLYAMADKRLEARLEKKRKRRA